MTPKEKALELANKFFEPPYKSHFIIQPEKDATKRALLCANEIVEFGVGVDRLFWDKVIKELNEL